MTDKELRRMSRQELVEIIYQQKKVEEALRKRLEAAEKKLNDREIKISNAGSIAEAALALNGVFEAAQKAADDYLRSIRKGKEEEDVDSFLTQMKSYIE